MAGYQLVDMTSLPTVLWLCVLNGWLLSGWASAYAGLLSFGWAADGRTWATSLLGAPAGPAAFLFPFPLLFLVRLAGLGAPGSAAPGAVLEAVAGQTRLLLYGLGALAAVAAVGWLWAAASGDGGDSKEEPDGKGSNS